jgi:hypothetical protein
VIWAQAKQRDAPDHCRIAEYFQSIHKTCENDGSLMRHQIKKIRVEAKCELCRVLEEQYAHKKRLLSNQRRSYRS